MNLNANERFSQAPFIGIERSRFTRQFRHITTCNAGLLVPFFTDDVLPGTTLTFDTQFLARMLTPLHPVMDDCFLDLFYFFVPYRLLFKHFEEFFGENKSGHWTQPVQYNIPFLTAETGGFAPKSVADHLGFPTGVENISVSQLPFRAYCLIFNEFFRNQNTTDPTYFIDTDVDLGTDDGTSALYGGDLLPVERMHDYFSDALPTAQKLPNPVTIPLADDQAPVITGQPHAINPDTGLMWNSTAYASGVGHWDILASFQNQKTYFDLASTGMPPTAVSTGIDGKPLQPSNLYADLSNISAVTVSALREAFAVQRFAERLAYGSRYTEQLKSFYGLEVQDSRLQRPEFLGSQRFPIVVSQVVQSSATESGGTPQGNTAAYSKTGGVGAHVSFSSQEHGIVMGLFCIRHARSYQQGIPRQWSRRTLYQWYNPVFGHLSNQPILNKEVFAQGDTGDPTDNPDEEVFGYQEAWAEYRYFNPLISGEMRSNYASSLDVWHYGDDYATLPTLSADWMHEGSTEIARTLAVSDPENYDQFLVQLYAPVDTVAPMPLYSVPGMLDHF